MQSADMPASALPSASELRRARELHGHTQTETSIQLGRIAGRDPPGQPNVSNWENPQKKPRKSYWRDAIDEYIRSAPEDNASEDRFGDPAPPRHLKVVPEPENEWQSGEPHSEQWPTASLSKEQLKNVLVGRLATGRSLNKQDWAAFQFLFDEAD